MPYSEFQNPLFHMLRISKLCPCLYFLLLLVIDFVLICVATTVSIHLCFVCRRYFYLSYVASR